MITPQDLFSKIIEKNITVKFNSGKSERYSLCSYHNNMLYVESMDLSKPGAIIIPLHSIESIYVGEIE